MGEVAVTLKVMPESPEVDLEALKVAIEEGMPEDAEFQNILRDSELISNFKEIDEFGAPLTDMNGNPIKQYDYSIKSNFYTNLSAKSLYPLLIFIPPITCQLADVT